MNGADERLKRNKGSAHGRGIVGVAFEAAEFGSLAYRNLPLKEGRQREPDRD
jgi:hypothetical protein